MINNSARLYGLDNLKIALTILVVAHHAGQPYGGSGGFWYFDSQDTPINLGIFFSTNAGFFMSLFFFISAYFMPSSYHRKGAKDFIFDRVKRFGIPLVFGFLILVPLMMYGYYVYFRPYEYISFWTYYTTIYFGISDMPSNWTGPSWPDMQFAHLWFIQHLLLYTVLYAGFRLVVDRIQPARLQEVKLQGANLRANEWTPTNLPPAKERGGKPLRALPVIIFTLLLALITFIVRIWYPIDTWVGFLGFIQTEFAHVPQYIALFIAGMLAYQRNWINHLSPKIGLTSLLVGVALTIARYCGIITGYAGGGWSIEALQYALLETTLCVGLCIGLTSLFQNVCNVSNPILKRMSNAAFGVYIIHVPVLVLLQYALADATLLTSVKVGIVIVAGTAISFMISMVYQLIIKRMTARHSPKNTVAKL